ncbi:HsdM family class I SAM-dependent methyltransferase [Acetobacter okinawensis]|uniref:HsdM family class I SAM-dependent methyltransferase n=1 Tax=Acetobacter okinawensis TaxID=1076594 RepID=UPI000AB02107|nr:N-6 DNA methylase [Acetobacter okinawensis]
MAKRHTNRVYDLESMFVRLEELVLANSGENEFEEVFKLLIAKLWDEKNTKTRRFKVRADNNETYSEVHALLREAERAWPGILEPGARPGLTPEHLQVCVEALSNHSILDSTFEVLDSFFEFMVSRAAKGTKGQYFTPRYVAELCVRMLAPHSTETVLDPACGSGGFLVHALNHVIKHEQLKGKLIANYCETKLWGFDIDDRAVRVAKALMVLSGDGKSNIIRVNSLLKEDGNSLLSTQSKDVSTLTVEDVMRTHRRRHKGFDIILTNPPFAGEVRERQMLDSYQVSHGKIRIERDILFLERCVELLRTGGRMAIVLPHNKFAAKEFAKVRSWLIQHCRILAVVGLGRHTFLPHTHQKASILFVQKRAERQAATIDENIYFALSEKDGKTSKGKLLLKENRTEDGPIWDRVDHDFDEIVTGFRTFCKQENIRLGS